MWVSDFFFWLSNSVVAFFINSVTNLFFLFIQGILGLR